MKPEIGMKVPVTTPPHLPKGSPNSTVGFLAADGKWKTQHGPAFTVSMRYECDPHKCS